MHTRYAALLLASNLLFAQDPPSANSFMPDHAVQTVFVDFVRLRDYGVWDELKATLLWPVLKAGERAIGVRFDHHDRMQTFTVFSAEQQEYYEADDLTILEFNQPITRKRDGWAEEGRIGSHQVRLRQDWNGTEQVLVMPHDRLEVLGARNLVEPVLTGKSRGGTPSPDLLSLLSGKGVNLAYMVMDASDPRMRSTMGMPWLQGNWPEDDPPTHVMFRLRALGTVDEPQLQLEMVIRHRKAGDGAAGTEASVKEWIDQFVKDKRMASLFSKVKLERKGSDVIAVREVGSVREAAGWLGEYGMSMMFWFLMPMQVVAAQGAAEVVVEEALAPAATEPAKKAEPKKEEGKKEEPPKQDPPKQDPPKETGK